MIRCCLLLIFGSLACLAASASASASAQTESCRDTTVNIGGKVSTVRMCKSTDGVERVALQGLSGGAAGFRSVISYSGSATLKIWAPPRMTRRLTPIEAAFKYPPITREFSISIDLTFDGNQISGRFTSNPALGGSNMRGEVDNGTCRLISENGAVWMGPCGPEGFSGTQRMNEGAGDTSRNEGTFRMTATKIVSFEERDRQRAAAAAEQQRVAAEAERQRAAEAARIAALPAASIAQVRLLADAIGQDSQSWSLNRYDAGSLTKVRVDRSGGAVALVGDYTYNGGSRGWISGRLGSGRIECIRYHDTSDCAPLRAAGFAGRGGRGDVVETVRIAPHKWYRAYSSTETYFAVADIKKLGGDKVSVLQLYDNLAFADATGSLQREEVDCSQFTESVVSFSGAATGNIIHLYADNREPEFFAPGTVGRVLLNKICTGTGLVPITDPIGTASRHVRGR